MTPEKAKGIIEAVKEGTANAFISDKAIVEACDEAISALKKQIPKKAYIYNVCPECDRIMLRKLKFCPRCGQALKWEPTDKKTTIGHMSSFTEGQYIIYRNADRYELGKIKRITKDGAFVWYSSGETAAKTAFEDMHQIVNDYVIGETSLGGAME